MLHSTISRRGGGVGSSTGAAEAGTLAVRDYYPYWRDRGEVAAAGKLLMVDSRLSTARHDIFFDDNIRFVPAP